MTRALPPLLLALLAACFTSVEEEAARDLGPEVGDPGPTHRPGQPCLVCHGPTYSPGEEVFALAGTIYRRATDTQGLFAADVQMTDADDRRFTVLTNEAGNFMVRFDEDVSEPTDDDEGRLLLPFQPTFPVHVEVRDGVREKEMRNVIAREGSCAHCHTDPVNATSNGRVFVEDP
jgi:hypothetical protein